MEEIKEDDKIENKRIFSTITKDKEEMEESFKEFLLLSFKNRFEKYKILHDELNLISNEMKKLDDNFVFDGLTLSSKLSVSDSTVPKTITSSNTPNSLNDNPLEMTDISKKKRK